MQTYSFKDVTGSFLHPSVGAFNFDGVGIGEISVGMANERTVHEPTADGKVMVSKLEVHNGQITIQCPQTSDLNAFLQGWFNYVDHADSSEWATAALLVRCVVTGKTHACTGVSPQKEPDQVYQKQEQMVSWILMAADIRTMNA